MLQKKQKTFQVLKLRLVVVLCNVEAQFGFAAILSFRKVSALAQRVKTTMEALIHTYNETCNTHVKAHALDYGVKPEQQEKLEQAEGENPHTERTQSISGLNPEASGCEVLVLSSDS